MFKRIAMLAALLAFALAATAGSAPAQEQANFRKYPHVVDYAFVARYAKMPKPKGVMIIDSRPYKPKYVEGYIPTAVSIPASQFDKMTDKLPKDKGALLIFYCGGLKCPLSHKSAFVAEALGYTNVKVYAAGYPDYRAHAPYVSVGVETVGDMLAKGEPYLLVDARPYKKYLEGAIPSAVAVPEREFAARRGMLPADKRNVTLIYYCGGYACALSHKSAVMARALGYRKVMVAEAGYPGWKELYGSGAAAQVQPGAAEGAVDTAWFLKTIQENPSAILLIDVRDPAEYAAGHFPSAINMPVDAVEKQAAEIPTDKPIVFACSTGARAGEAYYLYMDLVKDAKNVYYLEATNSFGEGGAYTVHPNK